MQSRDSASRAKANALAEKEIRRLGWQVQKVMASLITRCGAKWPRHLTHVAFRGDLVILGDSWIRLREAVLRVDRLPDVKIGSSGLPLIGVDNPERDA